ncbi:3-oxoadipate enol-lactonase [Pararhodobacter zhoushanensis]|uniref:3-oxoadipate enol-lactonase n=1 Tax=Pararhodobacter zhoushanensis TaxID=2479545 RepID=A0ABT3H1F1_9RHOB|nr:3-oxoadipate enol-lactonase [Pararhodobacter zhoushanensis]MCW1933617.1 3-oxoadipate enol-lactonase [Pararhodobacter zhoushanensis]
MVMADLGDVRLNYRLDGDPKGAPVVLIHALGTDLRLWDALVPLLPPGLLILRYSLRGHGESSVPPAPYSMGALVRDAERMMDHVGMRDALVVGLSIGGLIAQGLAVKRLDLVRAVVLSNTAAKIGTAGMWQQRIEAIKAEGLDSIADATLERWFARSFRQTPQALACRERLVSTPVEGYCGCAAAIAGTDFYTPTSGLRLPLLAISGSEDGSTPPDLVRETADLVPGSRFALIRGAGHLPCVDQPQAYAETLTQFLHETGHVRPA